ncbi:hypothetical protein NA56DRAFT_642489 [Hyaloscypha hepaticicola]|uniref:Cell surface protein n=1 Tax=Hyaloscypha hepaticicola TaxID=2082293 RepID=A0A2J6QGV4_9HELO|nr:hypothetical protein NA56DRAFT_642489 [Hyaloscypha hepaticicola]
MSTMDKVKNVLHLNKEHDPASNTHHHQAATQNSSIATGSTNAGPHSSNLANKVDPRVDSDLNGSRNMGATTGTSSEGYSGTGYGTNNGATGIGAHSNTGNTTAAGPHSSNIANKLDPTVDSDLDGSRNLGARSNERTAGYSGTTTGNNVTSHTGTHGGISNSTNNGPHESNLANKLDPTVDSDLSSTGNRHGASTHGGLFGSSGTHATPGSGTAQNTAGPHNSDTMNKLDPRVDSNLDGSKTYGGNATRQ